MRFLIIVTFIFTTLFSEDFTKIKEAKEFIEYMNKKHKYSKKELTKLFSDIELQKDSLWFYTSEKKSDYKKYYWEDYSKDFLSESKIQNGVKFLKDNNKMLYKAYKEYKIPSSYIVAIIGIESNYGKYMGKHKALDTLVTLSFKKNRRNEFFKKELEAYLLLTKKNKIDPRELESSFAGALGFCQFMPSNFEKVAVDLDGDKTIRLDMANDAIGSVANYFKMSGWKKGVPVATRVWYKGNRFDKYETGYKTRYDRSELKGLYPYKKFYYKDKITLIKLKREKYDELWYSTSNFNVITTYNRSPYYAMAVHQLAMAIKKEYLKSKN